MQKEKEYCVDVFTEDKASWMTNYHPVSSSSRFGTYYTLRGNADDKKHIIRECAKRNIKSRAYESRWARNADYRKEFFKQMPPPYYCRYCGKRIFPSSMQVDHIVPVAAVKKSVYARWLLKRQGITNVNDIRNLAPSCRKCNRRKGSSMGIWLLRARLGRHPKWFAVRRIIRIIFFAIFFTIFIRLYL